MDMPEKIWICPSGEQTYSVEETDATPELQYIRADIATQLAEALEFYADKDFWEKRICSNSAIRVESYPKIDRDLGTRARQALSRYHGEKK